MKIMLIVQKFGGTSVANLERIKASAAIVVDSLQRGEQVVVVVSAMATETDRLITLYREIIKKPIFLEGLSEMDSIISTGEQVSAGLFAAYLMSIGIKARSFTGMQAGILTNKNYSKAKIEHVVIDDLMLAIQNGVVPVVTGFQGYCVSEKRITTLGRGGSDTSAIAIAAAIKADKCKIYKDVEGIFTADPHIVLDAKKIANLNHSIALEIAAGGAKVLDANSAHFALKYSVNTEVLSSFKDAQSTIIKQSQNIDEEPKIYNLSFKTKDVLVMLKSRNLLRDIQKIQANNVPFWVVSYEDTRTNLLAPEQYILDIEALFTKSAVICKNIATISIVGCFLREGNIFLKALNVLDEIEVNVLASSSSETVIMLVVDRKDVSIAMQSLHKVLL